MENKQRKSNFVRRPGIGTGTISLLVIFTVLCFSTLALLSLASAANNRRTNERSLESVHLLCEAQGDAAVSLADFDALLAGLHSEYAEDEAKFYTAVASAAREMGFVASDGAHTVTCTTPIDDANVLITQLEILPPGAGRRYVMVAQYSQLISGWTPETDGHLWGG